MVHSDLWQKTFAAWVYSHLSMPAPALISSRHSTTIRLASSRRALDEKNGFVISDQLHQSASGSRLAVPHSPGSRYIIVGKVQDEMLEGSGTDGGAFRTSFAAQETVRACRRRSRCDVFRVWPARSSQFSPGCAPQVAHGIANICFTETLMLLMLGAFCQIQSRGDWSIVHTDRFTQ